MFFNGLFNFAQDQPQPQRRPNQPNNHQNRQNNNGTFGGIVDFLQQNFMNPLFQPNNNQRQQNQNQNQRGQNPRQQNNQEQRPTFVRTGSKKQGQKHEKKKEVNKKVQHNENTGIYWKQRANEQLKQGRLETALRYYDKAIELNNTESIFFSNRARCLKKMGTFDLALKDAQQAIQLDNDNIKGHLLCGQILAEIGKQTKDLKKVSVAVTRLTKALTLCVGQHKDSEFQNQIGTFIYRAKKLLWYLKFEEIKQRRIQAISEYKQYLQKDQKLDKEAALRKLNDFIEATNESIIFQIPEYLTCRITLDLMEDPVVTDSGQVYERTAIQEHIERNGKTDPFTRKPISGVLYPCISVKKAIQDFLERNPWAYEFSEGETYNDISF